MWLDQFGVFPEVTRQVRELRRRRPTNLSLGHRAQMFQVRAAPFWSQGLACRQSAAAIAHHSPPLSRIVSMKMPGGDAVIVDRRKLTGYCLNPEHPRGKHKARVFATLGFTAENADELRAALLKAAASVDAQPAASDRYGDRYVLEFEIEGPQAAGIVRSAWVVRRGE